MEEKKKVWIKVPDGKEKEAVDILKKRGGKYALDLDVEDLAGEGLSGRRDQKDRGREDGALKGSAQNGNDET